ncbi:hypothetical protein SODALDRAFT_294892 [Sodiomyces alkalinus F11]|uniref:SPRY domain-containing protein n=1 Tax=Sodiomyces alkalinus (strain CBS 110278 / VKM F-3762 / F11) TaxID=1314773 RepID=A0A3N2PY60_SODAK|nr:hypothetical protein SODALDRAFT_294892 [Sodiomyces alkalinus F11]ROT39424.1 hypothetical protein SODALDRAFT_294892 [Sodiomyces alkalinus F11]
MGSEAGAMSHEAAASGLQAATATATAAAAAAAAATARSSSPASSIPQKRTLDEDHSPCIPSPLNPEARATPKVQLQPPSQSQTIDEMQMPSKRTKKDTFKKRESKGIDSSRATPDPKYGKHSQNLLAVQEDPSESSPLRYKLPPAKQIDFDPARGPVFIHHHDVPALEGGGKIEFFETSDHVYNKKSYHYTHCIADPAFPSSLFYRQTEPEPYGPHLSFEDSATHMFFDQSGRHVTTEKGFRMTRANVAIREGRFFWECKITRGILRPQQNDAGNGEPEPHGHVRMGFARREASVDAPVGFDAYSYGLRDKMGQKVYMSRPKPFFPPGEDLCEGDVLGLEIQLPSERLHRKVITGQYNAGIDSVQGIGENYGERTAEAPNIVRDRIPIRFKAHIYFEKIDYHTTRELEDLMNPSPVVTSSGSGSGTAMASSTEANPHPTHSIPALRTLPGSYIKVYKNGVFMGTLFENLLAFLPPASRPLPAPGAREGLDDGTLGYYPAVSVFRGGAAEVNFGPDFWYPPPGYEGPNGAASSATPPATATTGLAALRPVSERYTEQIVEDIVFDIIDEVDFWMQDGAKVIDRSGRDGSKPDSTGMAPGGEEIKEVVQDD